MAVGVFGKLPARRDFVQNGLSQALMDVIDPWLQAAVAQSRDTLGKGWLEAYLASPIWRFWFGTAVTGRTVLGALMPSVDGVGRYFPLCLAGNFEHAVGPPELNEQAAWFDAVEGLMLDQLADDGTYEGLLAGVKQLPEPDSGITQPAGEDLSGMFARLRQCDVDAFYGDLSCWWVPRSPDGAYAPRALMRRGLPSPVEYATMIAIDRNDRPDPDQGGA